MELQVMVNDLLLLLDKINRELGIWAEVLTKNVLHNEEGCCILSKEMFAEMDTNKNGFIEW